MDYATWAAQIKSWGGVATAWPFEGTSKGLPAARFTSADYAQAVADGLLTGDEPSQTGGASGEYVYVLFSAVAAPHTMTAFEQAQNAVFTTGDEAAGALGLPSLSSWESSLKVVGAILVGIIALGVMREVDKQER